jgi:alpha/beta superfamily hydrolase
MTTRVREIPGPVGRLEALLEEPPPQGGINPEGLVERGRADGVRAAVVLAHPHPQYGGTMHTKVVYQAA